jgi:hypothetical protein
MMAWPIIAAMAIQAGSSIAGGILGSIGASAQKKAIRKAAARNYNATMSYSKDMEKTLMENMTEYERDAADYRSSMVAARSAMGGVRTVNEDPTQKEVLDYDFDVDTIDYEKNAYKEIEKYNGAQEGQWYNKSFQEYQQKKADVKTDKQNTDLLKQALDNYTGRTPELSAARTSANAVEQYSINELQKDLNRTYKQGMQQVYLQRQQAYLDYQDMKTQANLYGLQGTLSLWSGLLGAGGAVAGGLAQMYGSGSSRTSGTSGGGVAQHQLG